MNSLIDFVISWSQEYVNEISPREESALSLWDDFLSFAHPSVETYYKKRREKQNAKEIRLEGENHIDVPTMGQNRNFRSYLPYGDISFIGIDLATQNNLSHEVRISPSPGSFFTYVTTPNEDITVTSEDTRQLASREYVNRTPSRDSTLFRMILKDEPVTLQPQQSPPTELDKIKKKLKSLKKQINRERNPLAKLNLRREYDDLKKEEKRLKQQQNSHSSTQN